MGKTSFLENLESKGTSTKTRSFGLQYSYSEIIYLNQNLTVNYFEISGGLKSSSLLSYPLNSTNIQDSAVFLVIDASSLQSAYNGLEQFLPEIHSQLEKKAEQLKKQGHHELVDTLRKKRIETMKTCPDL